MFVVFAFVGSISLWCNILLSPHVQYFQHKVKKVLFLYFNPYICSFPEDTSNPLNLLPRRGSGRPGNGAGRHASGASNGGHPSRLKSWSVDGQTDLLVEPGLAFKSASSSSASNKSKRQIRTSLEKLEQTQDELYQL